MERTDFQPIRYKIIIRSYTMSADCPFLNNEEELFYVKMTEEEKEKARRAIIYQNALKELEEQILTSITESSLEKDDASIRWLLQKIKDDWTFNADKQDLFESMLNSKLLDP